MDKYYLLFSSHEDSKVMLRILVSSFLQCKTVKKVKLEILKSFW